MTTIFLVSGGSQGHEMMQSKWQNNLIGRSEEKTGSFVALFVNNNVQPRLSQVALGSLINRTGIGIASIPILLLQFLLRLKFRFAYVISILSS